MLSSELECCYQELFSRLNIEIEFKIVHHYFRSVPNLCHQEESLTFLSSKAWASNPPPQTCPCIIMNVIKINASLPDQLSCMAPNVHLVGVGREGFKLAWRSDNYYLWNSHIHPSGEHPVPCKPDDIQPA